ncbi:MAG: 1-acyl-sn-glycerol-3-phosphate acyltransferase [Clostridia bacterium]|nr:1-acyl-sn-glycerol-3-phosphate acyltransferase [Clostridia bacterium]
MKKQETWVKPRHRVITALARLVLDPYCRWKYGVRVEPFKEQGHRQYLVLMNHQTAFDQFFLGMAFRGPVYYLASEDLFNKGWVSVLLKWAVNPIPIKKQTTDPRAVRNCLKVIKEGGTLALAPEGNRTYSGKTEYMNPAIVKMAQKFKLPIALLRIEGGYGVHPRWSDVVRKGKMRAWVSEVIEPEDAAAMGEEALRERIERGLYVDEGVAGGPFTHNCLAEYLERAYYVCPHCGLSTFESHGDLVECKTCGMTARYLPTREMESVKGDFPFRFTTQWYKYQCDFVNKLDTRLHTEAPLYEERASFFEVIPYKRKELLRESAALRLYGDRLTVDEGTAEELVFPFETADAFTVLGKNKVNIYFGDKLFQLKGDKRFNGLKYVNLYYRHKNIVKGNEHVEFLGL